MENVIEETKRGLDIVHESRSNSSTGKPFVISTISYQGEQLAQFINGNVYYARKKVDQFISTNRKLIRKCNKDLEKVIANNLLELKTNTDKSNLHPLYDILYNSIGD